MYIYAEEILLINFILNFLVFYVSARLLNTKKAVGRSMSASAVGTALLFLAFYTDNAVLTVFVRAVSILFIGVIIASNFKPLKIIGASFVVLCVSAVCCGFITLSQYMLRSVSESVFFFKPQYFHLMTGAVSGCIFSYVSGRALMQKIYIKRLTLSCRVQFYGTAPMKLRLLCDTGNLLKTTLGRPVAVIDKKHFTALTGCDYATFDNYDSYYDFYISRDENLQRHLSLIKTKTVDSNAYAPCLTAQRVLMQGDEYQNVVFAFGDFGPCADYEGIYNPILFQEENK